MLCRLSVQNYIRTELVMGVVEANIQVMSLLDEKQTLKRVSFVVSLLQTGLKRIR